MPLSQLRNLWCHIILGAVASPQVTFSISYSFRPSMSGLVFSRPRIPLHTIRVVHTLWEMWIPPCALLYLCFCLHNVIYKKLNFMTFITICWAYKSLVSISERFAALCKKFLCEFFC